jgi:hypothetical protein
MRCTVAIRPKPPPETPAAQIPVDDSEALAMFLIEHMLLALRRE